MNPAPLLTNYSLMLDSYFTEVFSNTTFYSDIVEAVVDVIEVWYDT